MGDSITEGTVGTFEKAVGDYVNVDDVVAILETDKVSVDVRSPIAGVITKINAGEGDDVPVGMALFDIDTTASPGAAATAPAATKEAAAAPPPPPPTPTSATITPPLASKPAPQAAPTPLASGANGSPIASSFLTGTSAVYVEEMHRAWMQDPSSV